MAITPSIYTAESADIKHFISGMKQRNDHYLHAVIDFPGEIDPAQLKQALRATFRAMPLLTCRFVKTEDQAYWEEAGWTEADMVRLIASDDRAQDVQRQLVQKLDEQKGPQVGLSIIRVDQRDSLVIVLNHMICDGGGIRDYLYLLCECYNLIGRKGHPEQLQMPSPQRRSFNQIFDYLSDKQLQEVKAATVHHFQQTEADHLPLEGDSAHPFVIRHRISAERFEKIKAYAKAHGATINDALFAAYLCALSNVLQVKQIVLDCPVNVRAYLPQDYVPGFCNLTSNIICAIPSHAGETYEEALKSVKQVMDRQKDSLEPLKVYWDLEQAYQNLPLAEAIAAFPTIYKIPINGMTNIGILDPKKLTFGSLEPIDASISGSLKYAPYFQIAVTTFKKAMTFSTNFHGTEKDYLFLDQLVQKMIASFPDT
ncbi:MAG: condensation domain-containing protein [Sporolactobacillus sp.]